MQDLEDEEEEDMADHVPFRQRPWYYILQLRKLIKRQNLPAALEFFEVRMGKEDQVRPILMCYDMLIAACGRAGYLDKAFELYRQMKKRRCHPQDTTYVGLFNACAECPIPEEAVKRLKALREELQMKLHIPNHYVYHSMIKAYGRCGDVIGAFQIADEMLHNNLELQNDTFCFLLMACISDKQAGFKHAIEVWRFMIQHGVKPDLYHYSLLIRAVRDCNLGSGELAQELLPPSIRELSKEQLEPQHQLASGTTSNLPEHLLVDNSKLLPFIGTSITHEILTEKTQKEIEQVRKDVRFSPNGRPAKSKDTYGMYQSVMRTVLSEEYHRRGLIYKGEWWESPSERPGLPGKSLTASYGMILMGSSAIPDLLLPFESQANTGLIAIGAAGTGAERLALLGGYSGILSRMQRDKVKPDKKFLSMLVEMLPFDDKAEDEVIALADRLKRKLDVDFFNMIIRQRIRRKDYAGALKIRELFESRGINSNQMTFGCLAVGCYGNAATSQLLNDMKERDLDPNTIILATLISNACNIKSLGTMLFLMAEMQKSKIPAHEGLVKRLERFKAEVQKAVIEAEKKIPTTTDISYIDEKFLDKWKKFKVYYKIWLEKVPAKQEEHPYAPYQYTVESEDNDDSWRKGKIPLQLYDDREERQHMGRR
ncbi:pentatricopeptide repeat-containing protein 1, mitochondrial-like isoform X2 [Paramacrobiotus metropolitanus]|nr:pentatricopeptide repeat-containing protein 1, mitochondrial-like isoform X2 [Paramacrobiotus metropolitanus]